MFVGAIYTMDQEHWRQPSKYVIGQEMAIGSTLLYTILKILEWPLKDALHGKSSMELKESQNPSHKIGSFIFYF